MPKAKPIKITETGRGFAIGAFTDGNGVVCSIQKSSAAEADFLWLGADEIGLKQFRPGNGGWVDIPTPDHQANTRMHLTQKNVKALLPLLQHFAETGELGYPPIPKIDIVMASEAVTPQKRQCPRYYVHPGNIVTGKGRKRQMHRLSAPVLAQLYGLKSGEYDVVDERQPERNLGRVYPGDAIHLYPRNDGKYDLPS